MIVVSYRPSIEEALRFAELAIAQYLTAPCSPEELKQSVDELNRPAIAPFVPLLSPPLDPEKPLILLVGEFRAARNAIRARGQQYAEFSQFDPLDWQVVPDWLKAFKVSAVVAEILPGAYNLLLQEPSREWGESFLRLISDVPNLVFVHEALLTGDFSSFPTTYYKPPKPIREAVNGMFMSHGIKLYPYRHVDEIDIRSVAFLIEHEHELLFRIYIPSNHMWADEADRFLRLFCEYLVKVGHAPVRLDQLQTGLGTVYEIRGEGFAEGRLSDELEDFSQLLELSLLSPEQAQTLLRSKHIDAREVLNIIARYSSEATRIHGDLLHKRERRMLSIRQRLESELFATLPSGVNWADVQALAESAVPQLRSLNSPLVSERPALISGIAAESVTINVNSQVVHAVNAVVAEEVQGNIHLTEYDHQILSLIREHGAERSVELASAVQELADPNAPNTGRIRAKAALKAFLHEIGNRMMDIGTGMLQSYLEKKYLGL